MVLDVLRGRQLLAVEQCKAKLERDLVPRYQMAALLREADGGLFKPSRMVEVLALVLQLEASVKVVAQAVSDTRPTEKKYGGGALEKRALLKGILDRICHIKALSGQWQ